MNILLRLLASQSGLGLAVMRVVLGLILAFSGYRKVFQGGFAVDGFRRMGLPVPELTGPFISLLELGGGALLVIGLFTRYLGTLFTIQFVVASMVIFNLKGSILGARLEILILVAAFVLATNGAGALALDRSGHRGEP